MSVRHIQFTVRGRVQGVNFRSWTASRANELGVVGWVRNDADGSVSGQAVGPAEVVGSFVKDLEKGPSHAKVEDVQLGRDEEVGNVADVQGLSNSFEVRRS